MILTLRPEQLGAVAEGLAPARLIERQGRERAGVRSTHPASWAVGTVRPILVPLDGSDLAERALPYAMSLARQRGAPLLLVRVVELNAYAISNLATAPMYGMTVAASEEESLYYLARQARAIHAVAPDLTVYTETRIGLAAAQLLAVELAQHAQMVVLTTHGRTGVARWIRGSVAEKVLRHGVVPVLLIRPWDAPAAAGQLVPLGRRVLVPLDGSLLAERVLPEACRLARHAGGEVILASVAGSIAAGYDLDGDPTSATSRGEYRAYLSSVAGELRSQGISVRTVVTTAADVAVAITELAIEEDVDLIALSTHGRGSVGRWLYGSVADTVAHSARVPVLLSRPAGSAEPAPGPDAGT